MKTLIAYSSKTGNTKKVAEAIHSSLSHAELKDISEISSCSLNYDVIIVGGWIDKGTLDSKSLKFAESIKNKKVGFFFTLGASPASAHAEYCLNNIKSLFIKNDNEIIGHYFCQGAIDPKLISWMLTLPSDHSHAPDEARKKRWEEASKHPDQNDLLEATKAFTE